MIELEDFREKLERIQEGKDREARIHVRWKSRVEQPKVWRHLGIIKDFVAGYWFDPAPKRTGPGLLEEKRLPLRRLYSYRIKSDYDTRPVEQKQLGDLLETVQQVIQFIEEKAR